MQTSNQCLNITLYQYDFTDYVLKNGLILILMQEDFCLKSTDVLSFCIKRCKCNTVITIIKFTFYFVAKTRNKNSSIRREKN